MKSKNEKPKKHVGRMIGAVILIALVLIIVVIITSGPDEAQTATNPGTETEAAVVETEATEKLLFEHDGISIYYQKHENAPAPAKGHYVWLRIVNDSQQDICVQIRDQSVNGVMVDCVFSPEILAGKTGIEYIWLYGLDERDIESFNYAEFKFEILETGTYDTIATSDAIRVP